MKQIAFLFFTFFILVAFSQKEPTSFYFSSTCYDSVNPNEVFDDEIIGNYSISEDGYNQLIITKDSIYFRSGTPIILSTKESKKKGYTITDEKLFGLDKKKGLHCKVLNDTVFTMYYQEDRYFNKKNGDVVSRIDGGYLLCVKESNQLYSYFYIKKVADAIQVKSIDHESQMERIYQFSTLQSQYVGGIKTYIAKPKYEEIVHFMNQNGFNETSVFKFITPSKY